MFFPEAIDYISSLLLMKAIEADAPEICIKLIDGITDPLKKSLY